MPDITFKLNDSEQVYTIKNVPTSTTVGQLVDAIQKNYPGKKIVYINAGDKTVYGDTGAMPLPKVRKVGPAYIDPANPGDWVDTGTGHYYNRVTGELRLK